MVTDPRAPTTVFTVREGLLLCKWMAWIAVIRAQVGRSWHLPPKLISRPKVCVKFTVCLLTCLPFSLKIAFHRGLSTSTSSHILSHFQKSKEQEINPTSRSAEHHHDLKMSDPKVTTAWPLILMEQLKAVLDNPEAFTERCQELINLSRQAAAKLEGPFQIYYQVAFSVSFPHRCTYNSNISIINVLTALAPPGCCSSHWPRARYLQGPPREWRQANNLWSSDREDRLEPRGSGGLTRLYGNAFHDWRGIRKALQVYQPIPVLSGPVVCSWCQIHPRHHTSVNGSLKLYALAIRSYSYSISDWSPHADGNVSVVGDSAGEVC